jgi:hypothetical protein
MKFDEARRAVLLEVLGERGVLDIEIGKVDIGAALNLAKSRYSIGTYLAGMAGVPPVVTRSRRAVKDSAGRASGVETTITTEFDGRIDPFSPQTLAWLLEGAPIEAKAKHYRTLSETGASTNERL